MIAALLLLGACTGEKYEYDSAGEDTGVPQCGRIHGTTGILMYQNGGDTVNSPSDAPDGTSLTSAVTGPIGDDRTYMAITNGTVMVSEDGGCNWDSTGTLPASGDWALRSAGSRVYAFDRASDDGARTDDLGLNWTTFATTEAFIGVPRVDASDPNRLRGAQARGIVTSSDGGDTWPLSGTLPEGLGSPHSADFYAADLDQGVISGTQGAWRTQNGGQSWDGAYTAGEVKNIAIHPDNPDVYFAQATGTTGTQAVWRTDDGGGNWGGIMDETQLEFGDPLPLWPLPGDQTQAISGFGPVENGDGDPSLALYVVDSDTGTHTVRITDYFHIHDLTFGGDRWLAAVDSIP